MLTRVTGRSPQCDVCGAAHSDLKFSLLTFAIFLCYACLARLAAEINAEGKP